MRYIYTIVFMMLYTRRAPRCRTNLIHVIYVYVYRLRICILYFNGDDRIAERFIATFRNGHADIIRVTYCRNGHPV